MRKLNSQQIVEIYTMPQSEYRDRTIKGIAADYGITSDHVSKIRHGKASRWLTNSLERKPDIYE